MLEDAALGVLAAFAQQPHDLLVIATSICLAKAMGESSEGAAVWLSQEARLRFAAWQERADLSQLRRASDAARRAADHVAASENERFEELLELWNLLVGISNASGALEERRNTLAVARMAMKAAPEPLQRAPPLLHNLSNAVWYLWEADPHGPLLLEAAKIERCAIAAADPDDPLLPDLLTALAVRTSAIWHDTGAVDVLKEGVVALRRAAELSPPDDAERQYGLSFTLGQLWTATGDLEALREAIDIGSRIITKPTAGPRGTDYRSNLSILLSELGRATWSAGELREAVTIARALVDEVPAGAEGYPGLLGNLANRLAELSEVTGDNALLAEALEFDRRARDMLSPGHPHLPEILVNLAAHLAERHAATADDEIAREALDVADRAVALAEPGSPVQRSALDARANVLCETWHLTGHRDALDLAVAVGRLAIDGARDGDESARLEHNESIRLMHLWQATADTSVLDEAIALSRSSLAATPSASPWRPSRLGHLSNVLSDRAASSHDPALMLEALEHAQRAAELTADAAKPPTGLLVGLARRLSAVWELTREGTQLDAAIDAAESALAFNEEPGPERIRCLDVLGGMLWRRWRSDEDARAAAARSVTLTREALTLALQLGVDRTLIEGNLLIRLYALWQATGRLDLLQELARRVDSFTNALSTGVPTVALIGQGGPRVVGVAAGVALRLDATGARLVARTWWSRVAALGEHALDAAEFFGRLAGRSHLDRLTARLEVRRHFDGIASLVAHAHLCAPRPDPGAAVVALERGLAVSMLEFQAGTRLDRVRATNPGLVERVEAIEAELASAAVMSAALTPDNVPLRAPLADPTTRRQKRMRTLRDEYDALLAELEATTGIRLVVRRSLADLTAIADRLGLSMVWIAGVPTGFTMVDDSQPADAVSRGPEQHEIAGICLRLDPDAMVRAVRLPALPYERLETLQAAFAETLAANREPSVPVRAGEHVPTVAGQRFSEVVEQLRHACADADELLPVDGKAVLIPVGPAVGLPLHLLTQGEPAVHLAAALLDVVPSSTRTSKSWLVVADPAGDLPGARAEGESIATIHAFVTLIREGQACVDRLPWSEEFATLHIAGHGTAEPMLIMHSADDENAAAGHSSGHDGHLRPRDIARHFAFFDGLDLFFMNCCFSGLTDARWREEAFGFAAAAAGAGTRYVICTRWAVNDVGAQHLAELFYKRYSQGVGARQAFALARAEIAADDPCTAHAYVLLGG